MTSASQTINNLSGVAGSAVMLGANTLTEVSSLPTNFAGVISGTGTLIKEGTGTLILSGPNTYSGGTTITSGALDAIGATALGTGSVVIDGASSVLNTHGTNVTNSGTPIEPTITVQNGGSANINGGSVVAVGSNDTAILFTGTGPDTVNATNASITGNVLAGVTGNIHLTGSHLTGWINQNKLAGASGIVSTDTGLDTPAAFTGLPPQVVNLTLDPSRWDMTARSTLN
jgi:autotransporter-associated beta strand protein